MAAVRQASICTFGKVFSVSMIPVLKDNFSYLIHDFASGTLAAVDVSEVGPVEAYIETHVLSQKEYSNAALKAVLTTHKHWDHCGGNEKIKKAYPTLAFYGSSTDAAPCVNNVVRAGTTFSLGELEVEVYESPCHTKGHVLYRVYHPKHAVPASPAPTDAATGPAIPPPTDVAAAPPSASALFTGDTFFVGGIGAFFEGTAADMCKNVSTIMSPSSHIDGETRLFPGHEYTLNFLPWSAQVAHEKLTPAEQKFIDEKVEWFRSRVAAGKPTVPSTIGDEKVFNMFMRVYEPTLQAAYGMTGKPETLMQKLYDTSP